MSKTSNVKKIECLKLWINEQKRIGNIKPKRIIRKPKRDED